MDCSPDALGLKISAPKPEVESIDRLPPPPLQRRRDFPMSPSDPKRGPVKPIYSYCGFHYVIIPTNRNFRAAVLANGKPIMVFSPKLEFWRRRKNAKSNAKSFIRWTIKHGNAFPQKPAEKAIAV